MHSEAHKTFTDCNVSKRCRNYEHLNMSRVKALEMQSPEKAVVQILNLPKSSVVFFFFLILGLMEFYFQLLTVVVNNIIVKPSAYHPLFLAGDYGVAWMGRG